MLLKTKPLFIALFLIIYFNSYSSDSFNRQLNYNFSPSDSIKTADTALLNKVILQKNIAFGPYKISKELLTESFGHKDLTETFNYTTGTFLSRSGGAIGDARVVIRGFKQNEIGIAIDEVPLEIHSGSWLYWGNWLNLHLFLDNIIISKGTPNENGMTNALGGSILFNTDNKIDTNNYTHLFTNYSSNFAYAQGFKSNYALSQNKNITIGGVLNHGTGQTFLGSKVFGGSYFLNYRHNINKKHLFSIMLFGSPQQHWQRSTYISIDEYNLRGSSYNPNVGYLNNDLKTESKNFYHRPFLLIKDKIKINPKNELDLSANFIYGNGGALRSLGSRSIKDTNGFIDFDAIIATNSNNKDTLISKSLNKSSYWLGNFRAKHYRMGGAIKLTNYSSKYVTNEINVYSYYLIDKGWAEVADLLGGDYVYDNSNFYNTNYFKKEKDTIWFNFSNNFLLSGLSHKLKLNFKKFTFSNFAEFNINQFKIYDYFTEHTGKNFMKAPLSLGGYNNSNLRYNFNNRISINSTFGITKRSPNANQLFPTPYVLNKNKIHETTYYNELALTSKTQKIFFDLSLYRIYRKNNYIAYQYNDIITNEYKTININGVNDTHYGIEMNLIYTSKNNTKIGFIGNINNYVWTKNVSSFIKDNSGNIIDTIQLNIKNTPLPNTAMNNILAYIKIPIINKLIFNYEFSYNGKYYTDYNLSLSQETYKPYKLPNYTISNIGLAYQFKVKNNSTTLKFNCLNLFNNIYITEAINNAQYPQNNIQGYISNGRNFAIGINYLIQ